MYSLFIDESGKQDLKNIDSAAPHFSLAGIIIHDGSKQALKIRADKIKFKYWGTTNFVLHANEIRQEKNHFAIFKTPSSKFTIDDFCEDLKTNFLDDTYKIGFVSINKNNYLPTNPSVIHAIAQLPTAKPRSNWEKQVVGTGNNLLKKAATELITMYLDYLIRKSGRGVVIVESSTEVQDILIYSAYNAFLVGGFPPFGLSSTDVRRYLTGISFVTKQNQDIESQLSDIAAHYLGLETRLMDGLITAYPKIHDESVIKILKSKTFRYKQRKGVTPINSYFKMY